MKQLLKALDAGFTAFCNELWLPTFGFHLFDDPADALEDVPVELAGSLGAPGDGPPAAQSPEAAAGGHPNEQFTVGELQDITEAALYYTESLNPRYQAPWYALAHKAERIYLAQAK